MGWFLKHCMFQFAVCGEENWEEDKLLACSWRRQIAADIAFLGEGLQKVNAFSFFVQPGMICPFRMPLYLFKSRLQGQMFQRLISYFMNIIYVLIYPFQFMQNENLNSFF